MSENLEKKIFLISPVRDRDKLPKEEQDFIRNYVNDLIKKGHKVHDPYYNTFQNDPIGVDICTQNRDAIRNSDEIHFYWSPTSGGSKFDFGMAFMIDKPVKFVNKDQIPRTPSKSFENVLHELDAKYGL
jgi:hypothetical protein